MIQRSELDLDRMAEQQQPALDFLADPAAHGGAAVRRIDTHAASVFLAGDRALKIKRAVRFPFLDYSTLDRRKAACEAEIAVNRAFAPEIYRGVVPITREANGFAIGGKGEPAEWAVDMRRFDESWTLDRLAEQGKIDAALADALARTVAKAHAVAPVNRDFDFAGELATIVAQNDAELRSKPELFAPVDVSALTQTTQAMLTRVRPLLAKRQAAGHVARCHGDLHLGNIVMLEGRPALFDAIEFDPAFATSDLLYDLAFLLMDMIGRGLREAANVVLNRYLTERRQGSDLDALAALPLFMSVRAAIRAKVTAARGDPDEAREYFSLACTLIAPAPPRLVAIGGLSGTGKSLLARTLAPALDPAPGAVLLRSDVERKALFGVAETDRLPATAYAPDVTANVYATLVAKAHRTLAAGHTAIVDAVFARAGERAAIAQAGPSFNGLFLTADLPTRIARVGTRKRDASDADARIVQEQEQYELGSLDWPAVDASGTPEETVQNARIALGLA